MSSTVYILIISSYNRYYFTFFSDKYTKNQLFVKRITVLFCYGKSYLHILVYFTAFLHEIVEKK